MRLNAFYWVRGAEYAAMAARSAASVKRVYEGARVIVYADEAHTELDNPVFDQVLLIPAINNMAPMVANLYSQVHYCLSEQFDAPTLFLDADVLAIQAPPGLERIASSHDLVVTARDHVGRDEEGNKIVGVARQMPYNYGVIWANNTHPAIEAFISLRHLVNGYTPQLQNWYGNQYALADLVGGGISSKVPRVVSRRANGWPCQILVESCDSWNYTPESLEADLEKVYFAHPKGDRKEIFQGLAEVYA